jgi:hypothetical protein
LLSDLGIPFVVGATIAIALRRRAAQLWIPGVPGVLFGIWWVTYGSDAPSGLSWTNLRGLPEYVVDSAASGLAAITGRSGGSWLWWGRALLVAVSIGGLVSVVRRRRVSLWLLVFLGTALSFWVLAGASYIPGREPVASRYQLFNATLLILMAAELFGPVRLSSRLTAAVLLVALIAFALNLNALRGGYDFMREQSGYAKAGIGALEIARGKTAPTFQLLEPVAQNAYLSGVQAARYFNATAAHGAPATYSPMEIAAADPAQRQAADHVLAAGYEMKLEPARSTTSRGGCRRARPVRRGGTVEVELPAGGAWVTNVGDRPFVIGVRRFAPRNLPVWLGSLSPHRISHLSIPRDSAARPWHLAARGSSELQVCPG